MQRLTLYKIDIELTKDNIKIIDSYKITDKTKMKKVIKAIKEYGIYTYSRSTDDMIKEWITHNRAYKLAKVLHINYIIAKAKDTDLCENESSLRLFLYNILGN